MYNPLKRMLLILTTTALASCSAGATHHAEEASARTGFGNLMDNAAGVIAPAMGAVGAYFPDAAPLANAIGSGVQGLQMARGLVEALAPDDQERVEQAAALALASEADGGSVNWQSAQTGQKGQIQVVRTISSDPPCREVRVHFEGSVQQSTMCQQGNGAWTALGSSVAVAVKAAQGTTPAGTMPTPGALTPSLRDPALDASYE